MTKALPFPRLRGSTAIPSLKPCQRGGEKMDLLFRYVTQLSLTENKQRSFMFVGKLALTAPCPFSRSNCDSSTCL